MMDRISTYSIAADVDVLSQTIKDGAPPSALYEPFQALVQRITAVAAERPVSVYVCSEREGAEERDLFVFALARILIQHIPSTLVVDCDFVDIGLHGEVPQRDALGFLDLLLYGSSIGVITQETTNGIPVVGAGSFPVTRRMPFVVSAFEDAARRLVSHARCVFFVGPARDDAEEVHPLVEAIDIPLLVHPAGTAGAGQMEALEESVASRARDELMSVRMRAPAAGARRAREQAPRGVFEPLVADEDAHAGEAGPEPVSIDEDDGLPRVEPVPGFVTLEDTQDGGRRPGSRPKAGGGGARGRGRGEPDDEPGYSSMVPRLVVAAVGVIMIAFVAWWFLQERQRGEMSTTAPGGPDETTQQAAADSVAATLATDTPPHGGDSTLATTAPAGDVGDAGDAERRTQPVETEPEAAVPATPPDIAVGRGGGTVLIGSEDIIVMDDLESNYKGWYVVHISSFRESGQARQEAAYLEAMEFPVFIVFLDLGAKGKWYRVYSGPFRLRGEASDVKKNLDDLERVRFTRISKVNG